MDIRKFLPKLTLNTAFDRACLFISFYIIQMFLVYCYGGQDIGTIFFEAMHVALIFVAVPFYLFLDDILARRFPKFFKNKLVLVVCGYFLVIASLLLFSFLWLG